MDADIKCDRSIILSQEDVCGYVQDFCNENQFYIFHFCHLGASYLLLLPFGAIFIFTAFYFLASTAEEYLSAALSNISKKLNMSQTLAGVTLLAFANGAPDVIATYTAGERVEGIPLIIGSIFGAGLFVTTVVVGQVLAFSGEIQANKLALLRDIGFYLIATAYIVFLGWVGEITVMSAFGFLGIYVSFVFTVLLLERKFSRQRLGPKEPLMRTISLEGLPRPSLSETELSTDLEGDKNTSATSSIIVAQTGPNAGDYVRQGDTEGSKSQDKPADLPVSINLTESESSSGKVAKGNLDYATNKMKHKLKLTYFHNYEEWREMSVLEKVFDLYKYGFDAVRALTVPAPDEENWDLKLSMLHPFLTVWFAMWMFDVLFMTIGGIYLAYFLLPFQAALSFAIWRYSDRIEMSKVEMFYSVPSFLVAMLWISFMAEYLIDFLELLGLLSGLNPTFLGMTLLAWGNSAGDFFANTSLAKMGLGIMALSGCFAGSLFNLQLGFGVTILRATLAHETELHQGSLIAMAVLLLAFLNLIVTLTYSIFTGFKFRKGYSKYLLGYYSICCACVTIYAIYLTIMY